MSPSVALANLQLDGNSAAAAVWDDASQADTRPIGRLKAVIGHRLLVTDRVSSRHPGQRPVVDKAAPDIYATAADMIGRRWSPIDYLHTAGATGSIPVPPTSKNKYLVKYNRDSR